MKMAPESIDEMIAAFQRFAAAHFALSEMWSPDQDGIGYLVTTKIGDLYARKGERVAGVERTLDTLERSGSDPSGVRLLRGVFYLRAQRDETPAERAARLDKARQTLRSLAASGSTINHRRALATLAALEFEEGRDEEARTALQQYVNAYPTTSWTWVARIRIGQCEEAMGNAAAAAQAYLQAAQAHTDMPLARVLGAAYAARAFELTGDLQKALEQHQRALAGWDNAYGVRYTMYLRRSAKRDNPFAIPPDDAEVRKDSLAPRIAAVRRALQSPGGAMVERSRALIARERYVEAAQELARMLKQHSRSPLATEARQLMHVAQVEAALQAADVQRADADETKAMAILEPLAEEPHDFGVTAAKIMRAALLLKRGQAADAEASLGQALEEWHRRQPMKPPSNPVEEDAAAIRRTVFLPMGGEIYKGSGWNAFRWPATPPPYWLVNSQIPVKLHDGEVNRVTIAEPFPDAGQILYFDTGQIALLQKMIVKLGGTKRREPRQIMETPNQPIGDSMQILALWQKFFPARPGHWGGWELEAYPVITEIHFTNAGRTKASAKVTIGYSGATVELEKEGGKWRARRLTSQWIT
jgi:TolA-binding protein